MTSKSEPANTTEPCPNCGQASLQQYRPFCSTRCKAVDLGHWLTDRYVIAGDELQSFADTTVEDD